MKAIVTRYHGPTDHKGARISARAEGVPSVMISYPHELSGENARRAAALALCARMNWGDGAQLVGGGLPDGRGYAFVFAVGTVV